MEIKLQQDALDCGLVVIQSFHKYYYDNWIQMNQLKEKVNFGLEGLNILELSNLGNQFGLLLEGFEGDFESLKDFEVIEPIISLINQEGVYHYIIITKIKNNKVYYLDPVLGKVNKSFEDFKTIYQNILIIVTKTSFQSKVKNHNERLFYVDFKIMSITIVLSIISLIFSFLSTFYIKIIIDKIIPGAMFNGLNYVTIAFVFIAFLKITTTCFKTLIIKKIENKISYSYLNLYFNKLYYCNISKLEKVSRSDHLRRIGTIQNISSFKANYIFTISSEVVTFLFSTGILIWISPKVFSLVSILSVFMILISFVFQKIINIKNKKILETNIDFSTKTIDLIYSQIEMKQPKYKNIIQKNVDGSLKNSYKSNYKMFILNIMHKTIIESLKVLIPFIIIYISSQEIFASKLSVGDMILFISIFSFFINPLDSFISLILNVPVIKQDIELLNFILNFEEEKSIDGLICKNINKLSLENYNFSYELGKNLFYINNLTIISNLQISGKNGCGKSTFLKVLATYLSGEGKYNIDDIGSNSYDVENIRNKIYYGANNSFLPNVSILQYITNNEKERIEKLQSNIMKYKLQNIFDSFNVHIEDMIKNNGDNFSSGQKQLIILLPLLIDEFELILLDESFENIDENNFEKIKNILLEIHKGKLFIEISHSKKYLYNESELNFERFNNNK